MPEYEYRCENCSHEFTIELSITEHSKKDKNREIHCPKCESTEVKHIIRPLFVTTNRKT